MKQKPQDYSSVRKAIEILMAFTPDNQEMGTVELSGLLGLHKSTVSRLLAVLTYYRLIHHDPKTRKYSLGHSAASLGRAVNRSLSTGLVGIAKPFLDRLRDSVGESVSLEVMTGDAVTLVTEAPGPPPVRIAFGVGERVPLHVSSGAKAILAFLPREVVDEHIYGKLKRYTQNTITNPDVFKEQLKNIRLQGVAFDRGEYNVDVHSIGAPILNHERAPIAAVSVCAPAYRIKRQMEANVARKLKKTAEAISMGLIDLIYKT